MDRARILLVPSFTELEWGIRESLEEWADVASFDMPGVGSQPAPDLREDGAFDLPGWRRLSAETAFGEAERRGWRQFFVVCDSFGQATAVLMCRERPESILGLAMGHAALSHSTQGDRAALNKSVWDAMTQLAQQGNAEFIRHAIAQLTRGAVTDELSGQMAQRFPDPDRVGAMLEALIAQPEPIGEALAELELPLLLAKHEGCLGHTDEGFEDIVAAFPGAETAICPEQCSSSPAFAAALREFCRAG